jgi:TetR/AcrR family transcriptional regulator, cholesterol catabolism regulator
MAEASSTRERPGKRPDGALSAAKYDAKRRELVDIAAGVFARQGFHATSIDDLVEATGLKRGGLYHYIASKEDLLIAAHERFIEPLLENARAIAAEDLPAEEALRRLAHALMHDIAVYQDQVTVFLHEWRAIEHRPEWSHVRRARHEFEEIIQSILRRGQDEGVFAPREAELTCLGFLGMFNYSYQWYRPRGPHSAQEIAEHFSDIFIAGIRTPGQ